tara:strand:+ start:156 stop:434 length:279 start_codon:yes stop_codon:yes gene_type:complete
MAKKEKDVFVVLEHAYIKSKEHKDKWEVREVCNVVDNLKTRLTTSATCIINITQKTVVKNRAGGNTDEDYNNLIKYLTDTYPDQFKQIGYEG